MTSTALVMIQANAVNVARLFSAGILSICVLQIVLMLSYYWHLLRPLRKQVGDGKVVAPPVGWTFAYHVIVALLFSVMAITRVQLAIQNAPSNVSVWATPPLAIAMVVVISKFQTYYSRNLRGAVNRQWRSIDTA